MSIYLISDIHGCYKQLKQVLKQASFNIKKDYLWIAGDLVARGPNSLEVTRYLYSIQDRVKIVLGNHDLNLIAVYSGIQKNKKENYFDHFLSAPDSHQLINWMRSQSILHVDKEQKIIMVHAGISPKWNINTAIQCALEVQESLLSNNYSIFLKHVFNNSMNSWNRNFNKIDRLRYSINVFTRMRYCYPDGKLDLVCKKSPSIVQYPLIPWFRLLNNKLLEKYSIIFGHWSSLKGTNITYPFIPLDKGCCWGGELFMLRWDDKQCFYQPYLR